MFSQKSFKRYPNKRNYSNNSIVSFNLKNNSNHVKLIKMERKKNTTAIEVINDFIKFGGDKTNNIFIGTTLTKINPENPNAPIHPGHNFVFISDAQGQITKCLSKHPTLNILCKRKRIPDNRFSNFYNLETPIFTPTYYSLEEEIERWLERADKTYYPLFIHTHPITSADKKIFEDNIEDFKIFDREYSLHSTFLDKNTQSIVIPASNCNSAFYKVIFGVYDYKIQELFTQHAVFNTIKNMVENEDEYRCYAEDIGLTGGIEYQNLNDNFLLNSFTC